MALRVNHTLSPAQNIPHGGCSDRSRVRRQVLYETALKGVGHSIQNQSLDDCGSSTPRYVLDAA